MIQVVLGAVVVAAAIAVVAAGAGVSLQKQNLLVAQNLVQGLGLVLDQNLAHQQDLLQDPDLHHHLVQSMSVKAQKNEALAGAEVQAKAGVVAGARVYLGDKTCQTMMCRWSSSKGYLVA